MTNRQSILFAITMALPRAASCVISPGAGYRATSSEKIAAEMILEHLERSNYEVRQGPPRRLQSTR